jgi:hypothetical protein
MEGLQRGGLIASKERRTIVLLHVQGGELEPRESVFKVAPDPLDRVQLGAVRRQEDQAHVGWEHEPLGRMCAAVVQHQEIEAVRKGVVKLTRFKAMTRHAGGQPRWA